MNSKTRIIVIKAKELIAAVLLAVLAIIIIVLIVIAYNNREKTETPAPTGRYVAGVYSSSVTINGTPMDIRVTVDTDNINDIEMVNVSDSVTTMYPLIDSSFNELKDAVIKNGGTEGVFYEAENKYTSTMILKAIENALAKAAEPAQ